MEFPLNKKLMRVKIESIINLILTLDGFGIVSVDYDLLQERLHNLGFVYKRENKKHGQIVEK